MKKSGASPVIHVLNDDFVPQFLHSETDKRSVLESHLLLLTEDGCESEYEEMCSLNLSLNRWEDIIWPVSACQSKKKEKEWRNIAL